MSIPSWWLSLFSLTLCLSLYWYLKRILRLITLGCTLCCRCWEIAAFNPYSNLSTNRRKKQVTVFYISVWSSLSLCLSLVQSWKLTLTLFPMESKFSSWRVKKWKMNQNTYHRLHLPVNARAKNMFTWRQTSVFQVSNFQVSPPKLKLTWPQTSMFQVSNVEVSPLKCSPQCFFASPYQWFSQVFLRFLDCDDSKLSEPG